MTSSIHEEAMKKAIRLSCFAPDAGHIHRDGGVTLRKSLETEYASIDGDGV
jgi:hypothetical protein